MKTILFAMTLLLSTAALSDVVCNNIENAAVPASTPLEDFILHEDGTATHQPTNLMWSRCPVGQSWQNGVCLSSFAEPLRWAAALDAAALSSVGGYDDWRLPDAKELTTIVEYRCHFPAINREVFRGDTAGRFWTSSPALSSPQTEGQAWAVNFRTATVAAEGRSVGLSVRLVRTIED